MKRARFFRSFLMLAFVMSAVIGLAQPPGGGGGFPGGRPPGGRPPGGRPGGRDGGQWGQNEPTTNVKKKKRISLS